MRSFFVFSIKLPISHVFDTKLCLEQININFRTLVSDLWLCRDKTDFLQVKGCNKSIRKIGIEHFLTVFSRFEFIPRVLSKSGESQVGVFVGFVLRTLYSTTGNHLSESVISSYSSSTRVSRQNSPFSYKTICAEKLNFIPRVFFGHSNLNWSRWFEGGFKEGVPPVQNFPNIFRP